MRVTINVDGEHFGRVTVDRDNTDVPATRGRIADLVYAAMSQELAAYGISESEEVKP